MRTPRRRRTRKGVRGFPRGLCTLAVLFFAALIFISDAAGIARAFIGPSFSGGVGNGAIGVDSSNNVSLGTSTTAADTKLFVLASSTGSGGFAMKVFQPGNGPLFVIRNDGKVGVGATADPLYTMTIGGNANVTGSFTAGSFAANVPAGNVTAGVFATGNFAFPSSLGVNTNTQVGLPQPLSVYGNAYVQGNVGIGTTSPTSILDVRGGNPRFNYAIQWYNPTQGYVAGGGSAASFAFDVSGTNVFNIAASGNVGIGTTSPTINGGGLEVSRAAQAGVRVSATGAGGKGVEIGADTTGGYIQTVTSGANLRFYTDATAGPKVTFDSTGNVGIGNTNPGQKLDVSGNVNVTGNIVAGGTISGTYSGTTNATNVSAGSFGANTGGGNYTFPASVGIGTTIPGTSLDVVGGTIRGNSGLTISAGAVSLPAGSVATAALANSSVTVSAGSGLSGGGPVSLGGSTSLSLNLGSTNTWTAAQTMNGGANFPGSGIWNTSGNVGVGNTSPAQKLDVTGNINASGNIVAGGTISGTYSGTVNAANVSAGSFAANTGGGNFTFPAAVNLGSGQRLNLNGGATYGFSGQDLNIDTLNTGTTNDPLEINYRVAGPTKICASVGCATYSAWFGTDSNVGIGTTGPLSQLDIAATTATMTLSSGGSIDLYFEGSSASNKIDSRRSNDLLFQSNSATKMVLQGGTGNVGIGSTSPTQKLDVTGNANVSGNLTVGGTITGAYSGTSNAANISSGQFGANTGGGNYTFPANVGIGTTGPGQKFHVSGGVALFDTTAVGSGADAQSGLRIVAPISTTHYNWMIGAQQNVDAAIEFTPSTAVGGTTFSTPVMTIKQSGNVGIGNTNPGQKLDVSGNVNVTGNIIAGGTISGTYSGTVGAANVSAGSFAANTGGGNFTFPAQVSISGNSSLSFSSWGGGFYMQDTTWIRSVGDTSIYTGAGVIANNTGGFSAGYGGTAPPSGGAIFSGSVGVGTTSPQAKLDVYNGWITPQSNVVTDTSATAGITWYTPSPTSYGIYRSAGGWNAPDYQQLTLSWDTGIVLNPGVSYGKSYVDIRGNGLRVTAGNVGIGNTNPGQKLDVTGNANVSGNLTVGGTISGTYSGTTNATNVSAGSFGANTGGGNYTFPASVYVSGLRLVSDSNYYLMNYSGNNTAGGFEVMRNDGNRWGYFYGDGSGVGILNGAGGWAVLANGSVNAANTQVSFYTSSAQQAYINGSGLTLTQSNPTITSGGSYITIPNGLYVSGGTPYFQTQAQFRAGIHNDSAAYLELDGGTSGYTYVNGSLGIGNATPGYSLDVSGTFRATGNWLLSGASQGSLNMNGNNITSVNKLTVATVDPVYSIGGEKYATYGASVAGGVREEYVGRGKLGDKEQGEWRMVIDFATVEPGSDLWVWRTAVDFSSSTVDALVTPYGSPALISYEISSGTIIFRGSAPAEFSYRLTGKRFDWKKHPTRLEDQSAPASFVIP